MNFIPKFLQGVKKKEIEQPFIGSWSARMPNEYQGGFQKKKNFTEEYKNWPYACATARGEAVANIDLDLIDGDNVLEDDPILDLLNKPNPSMTGYDLFLATQIYKDLDGNAFWWLARKDQKDGKGEVSAIYILKPDRVHIVCDKDNPLIITGYVYNQRDGSRIPFTPEEIIHHKKFNPLADHPFPHRGMGIIEAAAWAIDTDNEIRQWNYKFFRNSAQPKGILAFKGEGSLSDDEYKRIKEEWALQHQGSENAHKIAIISGNMGWEQTSPNQTEMDFNDQKLFNRDEVLSLFRVPKPIVAITDDVNRANAEAAIYVFAKLTIDPEMKALTNTLNEFLLPLIEPDTTKKFVYESPVPEDRVQTIAEYTAGIDKWFTRNEIRAREGLTETENGNEFFGTINQAPIDTALPEAKKAIEPQKKNIKPKTNIEKAVAELVAKLPKAKEVKQLADLTKRNYIEIWNRSIETNSVALMKRLVAYFEAQEKDVQKRLREEMKGLKPKEFVYKAVEDIVFDMPEQIGAGINLITPFIAEYLKQSGDQAALLVGDIAFDDKTPIIQQFIKDRAKLFAEDVNSTTRGKILDQVNEGIAQSETIDDISKRIDGVFEEAKTSRTRMIARTETSASQNEGAKQAYIQGGIEKWQWVVVAPEDEDCMVDDGEVVKIGDPFPSGAIQPPDPHPNCVCSTIPYFSD